MSTRRGPKRRNRAPWDYPELSDFERPLNERGRRDARRMAARAARMLPPATRLIASPATRAITTARVFAEAMGIEFDAIQIEPRLYEASRKILLELLTDIEGPAAHVALVGHNPGFSELGHTLAKCSFDELPTGAVLHLQLNLKSWREVAPDKGEVLHFLFPKDGLE